MKIDKTQITGLILAGGRGSRMGGVDKGLQAFRGSTMVQHVLARLQPQVGTLLINANQNLARYAQLGWPVRADDIAGFAGPLAGLQVGLRHCATPYLALVPCDSPCLPPDLVERLAAALDEHGADLASVVTGTDATRQSQSVFCLLKVGLRAQLEAYLQQGGRRLESWFATLNAVTVHFDDETAFSNINTLEQLQALDAAPARGLHEILAGIADYDADAVPVALARRIIAELGEPVAEQELLPILDALGRVLAEDIVSPIDVPAHDNSAMDGYALRSADLAAGGAALQVVGSAYAGHPYGGVVESGQCVRIMTGAVLPAACDTVIAQENVALADGRVSIAAGAVAAGENRRFRGEDLAAGSLALKRGKRLRPADIGLLASLGVGQVAVWRRLRVAFFSTGDELRSLGEALPEGCVYDSNRYTLHCMLERLGCELLDMGVVKDDRLLLENALRRAAESADVVITSGGVSVGAADYTKQLAASLGQCAFWSLTMRPGRPLAFGSIESGGRRALLFGLPGNPVAVMVSFYFFARQALLRLMGEHAADLPLVRVRAAQAIAKRPGRTEYQRGIVSPDGDGQLQVALTGAQGSGILSSMAAANCIVVLHEEQAAVRVGDMVEVLLFDGLV